VRQEVSNLVRALRAMWQPIRGREAALAGALAALLFAIRYPWRELIGSPIWHTYWDQSRYLESARALAALDLDPARHHYPPLYSLLAAPFTGIFPGDPFVLIDALCLIAGVAVLVGLFGELIGRFWAASFALGFLAFRGILDFTFILPWNSTLAALLVIAALFCLMRLERAGPSLRRSFWFSLLLGLLVPLRPLDAIVAAALYPFWLVAIWRRTGDRDREARLRKLLPHLGALALGGLLGPLLFLGFNFAVYGRALSLYVDASTVFAFPALAQKFVSIFFDSASLYLEPMQTIAARFPWVVLAFPALAICLTLGPLWLKAAVTLVVLQFTLYLAYADLVPNGLYLYVNIHYFRWPLWLAFLMLPAAGVLAYRRYEARLWIPAGAALASALALGALQLQTGEIQIPLQRTDASFALELPRTRTDYVDLPAFTADWQKTFFTDPLLKLDGRRLAWIVDARALQNPHGTRLLFTRPLFGGRLEFPATRWNVPAEPPAARAGRYRYALGIPRWIARRGDDIRLGLPLRLDDPIGRNVFSSGFSAFDGGRRIAQPQATLALALAPRAAPFVLRLGLETSGPAELEIEVGGLAQTRRIITLAAGVNEMNFEIPPATISSWRPTRLHLRPRPDSAIVPNVSITALHVE
jgi:hypothetical protein